MPQIWKTHNCVFFTIENGSLTCTIAFMKIKIKYNLRYPRYIGKRGIVLYPYVLISLSEHEARKQYVLHHERIHVQQVRKNTILKFYFIYLYERIINVCKYWNLSKAYRNISYEKDAYERQNSIKLPTYLA